MEIEVSDVALFWANKRLMLTYWRHTTQQKEACVMKLTHIPIRY